MGVDRVDAIDDLGAGRPGERGNLHPWVAVEDLDPLDLLEACGGGDDADQRRGIDRVQEIGEVVVSAADLLGLVFHGPERLLGSFHEPSAVIPQICENWHEKNWPACRTMARGRASDGGRAAGRNGSAEPFVARWWPSRCPTQRSPGPSCSPSTDATCGESATG